MAIACPSCGLENSDAATECRRCRAPFAEAPPEESGSLGLICQRCEAYNEPGVARCTTCGYKLTADEAPRSAAQAPQVETVAEPLSPAGSTDPTLSEELHALAISAEEAADAGLHVTNGAGAAENPPAAKFCSECGTPFAKAPQADARPPKSDPPPSVSVIEEVPPEDVP